MLSLIDSASPRQAACNGGMSWKQQALYPSHTAYHDNNSPILFTFAPCLIAKESHSSLSPLLCGMLTRERVRCMHRRVNRAVVSWPMQTIPCLPLDFPPPAVAAGKKIPNKVQGDGLHKDAGGSLWFNPPRPIGRARSSINKRRRPSFLEKNGKVWPAVCCYATTYNLLCFCSDAFILLVITSYAKILRQIKAPPWPTRWGLAQVDEVRFWARAFGNFAYARYNHVNLQGWRSPIPFYAHIYSKSLC